MSDKAFRHEIWVRLEPFLAQAITVEGYLQSAAELAQGLIGVDGSYSLSTTLYGHILTVGTSDRLAWDADQVEFDTESGPCVMALRTGALTTSVDLSSDRRWPAWSTVAHLLGFQSAAGVPAEIGPDHRIALNLYSREPDVFDDEVLHRATLFTEEVARSIPTATRIATVTERAGQLEQALASRSTIDQALGVLMAQNRCSRDSAFGILRRASQNSNTKVRDVAAAIIERYTGHPAGPPVFTEPGAEVSPANGS